MKLIAAALVSLLATGALAQSGSAETGFVPGIAPRAAEPTVLPVFALLTRSEDPLAYTDLLDVGQVGTPGIVAFGMDGMSDADIATGSLGPAKR